MATSAPGINRSSAKAEPADPRATPRRYYIDLPLGLLDEQGDMLDWVIGFAFDTLDARYLDLRIVTDPGSSKGNTRTNRRIIDAINDRI